MVHFYLYHPTLGTRRKKLVIRVKFFKVEKDFEVLGNRIKNVGNHKKWSLSFLDRKQSIKNQNILNNIREPGKDAINTGRSPIYLFHVIYNYQRFQLSTINLQRSQMLHVHSAHPI